MVSLKSSSLNSSVPPFPVFQGTLVLPPKAANDLLTGPLIIAGFIPPACLLVRNHLFYIKKMTAACFWGCWQQGGEEKWEISAHPTALKKISRLLIKHHITSQQLASTMWRHRCAGCKKHENTKCWKQHPACLPHPDFIHLWKTSAERKCLLFERQNLHLHLSLAPCSSSVLLPKMTLQSAHDVASVMHISTDCQIKPSSSYTATFPTFF